jgi:hypothetical protein
MIFHESARHIRRVRLLIDYLSAACRAEPMGLAS